MGLSMFGIYWHTPSPDTPIQYVPDSSLFQHHKKTSELGLSMSTAGCGGQRYPEFQMAPGLGHPAFCLGLAIRVSWVSRKLLVTGCGLFSHVCSLNSLFYKMLAWFFHCEGATIRQLEGSECHQSQLASCFKGSDEVERTIAHVRSQDSPNFQEASIWISGVVWPNHSSKGVCPKTVTAFHWLIMFIMNTCHETRAWRHPLLHKKMSLTKICN